MNNKLAVKSFLATCLATGALLAGPATIFAQQLPSDAPFPLTNSVSTVYVSAPAGQPGISDYENQFISNLSAQDKTFVEDLRRANYNQDTNNFWSSSEGHLFSQDLKNNPQLAVNLFKNSNASNRKYWNQEVLAPFSPGETIKFIFPDGSSLTKSSGITPISSKEVTSSP